MFWADERPIETANPWLVRGLLPKIGVAILSGNPGVGKSAVKLHLARCLWDEADFFGHKIDGGSGTTFFVASEAHQSIPQRAKAAGGPLANGELRKPMRLACCPRPPDLLSDEGLAHFIAHLKFLGANLIVDGLPPLRLVVFDTFSRSFPTVGENNAKEVGLAMVALEKIATTLNLCVVASHHLSKGTDAARGSGRFEGDPYSTMLIRGGGVLRLVKCRDAPDNRNLGRFQLSPITVGQGADGEDITSCYVREDLSAANAADGLQSNKLKSGKLLPTNIAHLKCAYQKGLILEHGEDPEPGFWPERDTVRRVFIQLHGGKPASARKAFDRALALSPLKLELDAEFTFVVPRKLDPTGRAIMDW